MPLNPVGLESDLLAITGPDSIAAAASDWADAVEAYASGVIPASTTVTAAAATLETALVSAFGSTVAATTAAAMEAAFLAFATTIALGMLPAWTGTPPPAPVGFSALLTTNKDTAAIFASDWASAIDAWTKTGTAILVAPPNTPVTWT